MLISEKRGKFKERIKKLYRQIDKTKKKTKEVWRARRGKQFARGGEFSQYRRAPDEEGTAMSAFDNFNPIS
jgi:hypothetical protein